MRQLVTHYYTGQVLTQHQKLSEFCVVKKFCIHYWPHLSHYSDHGLPVNSTNARGETPLHDAVAAKSWDVVQELLRLGADKEIPATTG